MNLGRPGYIGALRATRTAVLDGYMMGALDSLPVSGSVVADPERMMIIKCDGERKCLFGAFSNEKS